MTSSEIRSIVLTELEKNDGKLPLRPCWVTRDFLPPGKRLGLKDSEYPAGKSGNICERWLVSETEALNAVKIKNEGLSYLQIAGENILLSDAIKSCREEILGIPYAKKHDKLNRLLKIYDYKNRLFYHIHQMEPDARKVNMNSKEEAYHYLDADLGAHPETFFGVHPYIVKEKRQKEIFLPFLREWKGGDEILQHSRAYLNVPGEGFHLPAGILHAPGTALTLELQESSDVMAVLQPHIEGIPMSKDLLLAHVPADEKEKYGEEAVLREIDWEACADPYFYENHRLYPQLLKETVQEGGYEEWIWYNTPKFSGMRITVTPGGKFISKGLGVHGLFVWRGEGKIDGCKVEGQKVSLTEAHDEFLITHDKAVRGLVIENTGSENLVAYKFFGPEINDSIIPHIKKMK
jgi:hypothetical protein